MPIPIACPFCDSRLRVPEALAGSGRALRCPKCTAVIPADVVAGKPPVPPRKPTAPPPEEHFEEKPQAVKRRRAPPPESEGEEPPRRAVRRREEDEYEEERPRPRRRYEEDDDLPRLRRRPSRTGGDWRKVRAGITFVLAAVFVMLASWLVLMCAGALFVGGIASVASSESRPGQPPEMGGLVAGFAGGILLVLLAGALGFVSKALEITGMVFGLFVPARHGAKGLAIAALVLSVGALLMNCGGSSVSGFSSAGSSPSYNSGGGAGGSGPPSSGGGGGAGSAISLLSTVLTAANWIVFLLYLRAVALCLHEEGLAASVLYLLIASIIGGVIMAGLIVLLIVLAVGAILSMFNPNSGAAAATLEGVGIVAIIAIAAIALLMIGLYIWYVMTLFQVRAAITSHLGRNG